MQPQFTLTTSEFVPSIKPNTNVFQRSSLENQRNRGAQGVPYKHNCISAQFGGHQQQSGCFYPQQSPIMPLPGAGHQKNEFCRNWIESAKCRFEDKCRYAHAQEELTPWAVLMYGDKFKANNCRTFYKSMTCNFGTECMFRHEHRAIIQLHRHYYTPHLYVLETLFVSSPDKTKFLKKYEANIAKLPVFKQIHSQFDPADEDSTDEASESDTSVGEIITKSEMLMLSETAVHCEDLIEKSPKLAFSRSGSSLNTTHDESANEESPCKLERSIRLSYSRTLDSSDEEIGQEDGELDVSLSSIGLDFV